MAQPSEEMSEVVAPARVNVQSQDVSEETEPTEEQGPPDTYDRTWNVNNSGNFQADGNWTGGLGGSPGLGGGHRVGGPLRRRPAAPGVRACGRGGAGLRPRLWGPVGGAGQIHRRRLEVRAAVAPVIPSVARRWAINSVPR